MHSGGVQTAVAALVMASVAVAHSLIYCLSEARKQTLVDSNRVELRRRLEKVIALRREIRSVVASVDQPRWTVPTA